MEKELMNSVRIFFSENLYKILRLNNEDLARLKTGIEGREVVELNHMWEDRGVIVNQYVVVDCEKILYVESMKLR